MPVGTDRLQVLRAHVCHRPGQLQVIKEPGPVVHPARPVVLQTGEEHMGLEGIEGRGQSAHVASDPLQPGLAFHGVGLGVRVGARGEPPDAGQDKRRLRGQRGHLLLNGVELFWQQRPVDGEFSESTALRRLEVGEDQRDQARHIRALQSGEKGPALAGPEGDLVPDEPVGLVFGQAFEGIVLQDLPEKGLPRDDRGIQRRRQVGLLVREPRCVVELKAHPFAQVAEGPLGILAVGQERLPVLEHPALFRVGKALRPLGHGLGELGGLPRRLLVQRMEEIVVLGARYQLTQDGLAIGGQREGLEESQVGVGTGHRECGQRGGEDQRGQAAGVHGGCGGDEKRVPGNSGGRSLLLDNASAQ